MSQHAAAQPFDSLAADYDESFTTTALGTHLRAMVWQRLDANFAGGRILEIGCGTGEDAIHLARRGLDVLATDASAAMLRIASQKAQIAGCTRQIEFRCLPMERLGAELAGERFDGVCSNFGAINCVPELAGLGADVAALLRRGAPLVWVVMGRNVPWEWAWFLVRGEWRKAFRRRSEGGVLWKGMRVFYPTPAELARTLAPHFAPVRHGALGFVLPPTFASGWLERSPRFLAALTHAERIAQRWQPLAALADHYIFEARRRLRRTDA
jgi:SAM-dependent methyltransferase